MYNYFKKTTTGAFLGNSNGYEVHVYVAITEATDVRRPSS